MSKPFAFNFKHFKKISSDNGSTMLRHPDGHEIRIAHLALSPGHRAELAAIPMEKQAKKMADGGEVEDQNNEQAQQPSMGQKIKQALLDAKSRLEQANSDYVNQQKQLFGLGPEHISDAEKQAIASQMGMNVAMGTINSPYSKVPIKQVEERMIPAMKQGYKDASELYNTAEQAAMLPKEEAMVQSVAPQTKLTPMQQVQKSMNQAGAKRYADGGDVTQPEPMIIEETNMADAPTALPNMEVVAPPQSAQAGAPMAEAPSVPQEDGVKEEPSAQVSEAPKQEAPKQGEKQSDAGLSVNPSAGYQEQLQGLQEQYKAEKTFDALKQKDLQNAIDEQQKSYNYLQQAHQDYQNEWGKISNEIDKGKINPDDYWQNHSKVMSAIGLIIGGFNPTSSPNAAQQMLEYQMDQNLKAQLANLNSKHNLIAASAQKYGNLRSGIEAASILQTQMLAKRIELSAAKTADPMARAKMLQLSGQLKLNAAPQIMRFNVMQGAMKSQQDGNAGQYLQAMRFVDPAMAKEIESRFVPDATNPQKGDFASIPIPEKVRDEITARSSLQEQAHNLRQWAKAHSGEIKALNPADVVYGQALASSLQDAYRRANGQGVFKESEANFVRNIISDDPTAFFNKYRTDPKFKALEDANLMQLNGVRKGYGLQPKRPEMVLNPQEQMLVDLARKMPNSPKAKMFLRSRGME